MIISKRARLIDKKHLAKHQRKYPAKYELIVQSDNEFIRYFQDEPTYAKAEAIRGVLNKQGVITTPFVYLEQLNQTHWYVCAFDDVGVNNETVSDLETILHEYSYDIHIAGKLLVAKSETEKGTDEADNEESEENKPDNPLKNIHPEKQAEVKPISEQELKPFELVKVKKPIAPLLISGIGAVLVLVGSIWFFNQEPPKPVVVVEQPKTEKQIFIEGYSSNVLASDSITNALNILIESKLAPEPIDVDSIQLDGDRLLATVKLNGARKKVVRDWLESSDNIQSHYNTETNQLSVSLPHVGNWVPQYITTYKTQLIDALEWLGAKVSSKSRNVFDDVSVEYYEMELTAHIGQISILSGILNTRSVTMKSLTMTKQENEIVKLVITFNIQGLVNES